MSSEEIKLLQSQLKAVEGQLKVYENHIYLLQNEIQYNQKTIQMEQAKQQNQLNGLASLLIENAKERRLVEEQSEANLMQRINTILSIDLNDFGSLNASLNGTNVSSTTLNTDAPSLMNGITLNSSSTATAQPSMSMLTSNRPNDQLLPSQNPSQLQIHSYAPRSLGSLQQSFLHQQLTHRLNQRKQTHYQNQGQASEQNQVQGQTQNHVQVQGQAQNQAQNQNQQQQQQEQQQQQRATTGTPQLRKKIKLSNQQQASLPQQQPQNTDPASILDSHLSAFAVQHTTTSKLDQPSGSIAPSDSVRSHVSMPVNIPQDNDSTSSGANSISNIVSNSSTPAQKSRKLYDQGYSFLKAPNSVQELWNEYSIGLNNQPSIKSLEMEYKTGWRRDPATSKKFNRRKVIYYSIEKGLEKGYSIEYCIQLLEESRWLDRDKNLKQPIGWLCHGNIPPELR